MTEQNPYSPPTVPTDLAVKSGPPQRWRFMVLVLVALQIALFGLSAPTMLSFARHGDISPLTVLAAALSALALFAAGVFLATKKRAAIYLFAVAAALIGLVLMQWRAGIVIIGLIVSLIGCAIGSTLLKSQAKV